MRKLIEIEQEVLIQCDTLNCDFVIKNEDKNKLTDLREYLNMSCPKCGENLLTEVDYLKHNKTVKVINFVNKHFSWLTIFSKSKKECKLEIN